MPKARVYGKGDLTLRDYTKIAPIQCSHGLPNYDEYGFNAQPNGQVVHECNRHTGATPAEGHE